MRRSTVVFTAILIACSSWSSAMGQAPKPFDFSGAAKSAKSAAAAQAAWAKRLKVEVEATNKLGMKLRLIPPGKFKCGSPATEVGRGADEAQAVVEIAKPFWMSVTEVTQEQTKLIGGKQKFGAYAQDNAKPAIQKAVAGLDTKNFPAEALTWFDAVTLCNQLSEKEGLDPYYNLQGGVKVLGGPGYRLPTEDEWEYAARAGAVTPFPFGKTLSGKEANVDGKKPYGGTESGPTLDRPCNVGTYAANAFGLHDMTGNVNEWCEDWYAEKRSDHPPTDERVDRGEKVVKGGSWLSDPTDARIGLRVKYLPSESRDTVGLRVVRNLE